MFAAKILYINISKSRPTVCDEVTISQSRQSCNCRRVDAGTFHGIEVYHARDQYHVIERGGSIFRVAPTEFQHGMC